MLLYLAAIGCFDLNYSAWMATPYAWAFACLLLGLRGRSGWHLLAGVFAALAVAIKAQAFVLAPCFALVYEADIGLLEEVSRAIAAQSEAGSDGAALAVTMQRLADERRGEVFDAYQRCIELVALWGDDPDGRAERCRAGLGRLVQRFEARLEYAPDLQGRVR